MNNSLPSWMTPGAVILVVLVVLAIGAAVFLIRSARAAEDGLAPDEGRQYPEGHWMRVGMSRGIALGIPLGLPFGLALDNIALGLAIGPALGVAIGAALGTSLEREHRDQVRPLIEGERRARTRGMVALLGMLALGILVLGALLLFSSR